MENHTPRSKQFLTVAICLGLVILAIVIMATAAQGAARFITTPVGYAPPAQPRVLTLRMVQMPPGLIQALRNPPKPVQRAAAAPTRLPSAPSGGCYAEPGTPPESVMAAESGNPTEWNHQGSSASGCWQIIGSTWCGKKYPNCTYEGYPNAASAPPHIQNKRAKELWAGGAGCSHWEQTSDQC